ncbi:glycosyltransferase involved in cell wall biosynthesis [Brevundimonas vesicularis]|uniref:Glycosyltransferase involved in cell wall biosynthesis n=1 Tax=Brevundimonas vesicularis TaxID=41276 RepID=A0A7W9L5X8_BREVE|nr:glycosyltransferase family 4 protein [Brevundimonas vesicularis]MBB5771820.1 glycosyltransferase involved in cell wall biosynthesis [Brevundimonas vesicularis]
MRTAILLPPGCLFSEAQPNSMETVVRTMAGVDQGGETRIFCCQGADDGHAPGVDALPPGRVRMPTLIDRLRAFRPDVIEHHQQVKQALAVQQALPETPHLLYRHNALRPPRHLIDRWRYRARCERLDGLVFVSVAERDAFVRTFPDLHDRAFAVPNPIDAGAWLASPEDREPVIAFAGRAMPEKGVDVLCAALPSVLDAHPDWRAVLMLNDWDDHARWAARHVAPLEEYGDRVEVVKSAPLGEVRRRMQTAAIALTPSVWDEPFGLTAIEAHAAGAALISSGRGGLREASGPHALYVDAVTPQTLTQAMDQLIRNPQERATLAREGQRYVMETHTPARRAAELAQVRRILVQARQRVAA